MVKSYKLEMSVDQLKFFIAKVKDLLSIDDEIIFKVKEDETLFYVLVGERGGVNAFKSFIFKTEDVFTFKDALEGEIRLIVPNAKKFESGVRQFLDYEETMKCIFYMNDDIYSDNFQLKNKELKLSYIGGDIRGTNTNISIEQIKETVDIDNIDFKFVLKKGVFDKIKKMGAIDNENDILTLTIDDNILSLGEGIAWNIILGDIQHDDLSVTFPKKYFKSITFADSDEIDVLVFDTFIFIDNKNTSLLISLELTV